jgi:hypothetical protein
MPPEEFMVLYRTECCHSVAIKTITIHVIEVVISITTIINLLI